MNIKKLILDTVFPIYCISCHQEGVWFCDKCFQKLIFRIEQTCPICKKVTIPNGEVCFECKYQNNIDGVLISSFYRKKKEKTMVAKLIHYYKYRFISSLGEVLGKILEKSILDSTLPLPEILIPVPLHPRRLRWRGFNQSEILADYLRENLTPGFTIPVYSNILVRNRYTKPQMEIKDKQKRTTNAQGAFNLNPQEISKIKGKTIFLIDDVATTGSTLFECARVLKEGGAKKVYGVVLARQ